MRTTGATAAVALAASLLLGGCGTASPTSPPTGLDELVVPTPSPDADDFVGDLDNPWFLGDPATQADPSGTEEVAGVEVTVVGDDYYAQDRRGNVWWFGTAGEWEAGVDGAQAGLAMPAEPRYGDSWRTAYVPGVVEDVTAVTDADAYSIVLETTTPLDPGVVARRTVDRQD
ncbi:hypothetical protein [Nocardioides abyssi]|uniref:Uncharacterized protein n=1 Tax=Nocardioides abyssi TaxID=3058370 RepID=A0ABT8EWP8_9ACTN|nr:hypothetical protein [Nocardioides abyssi]MDN4162386.1 hypothetical protein [Nocardioides abyssi]